MAQVRQRQPRSVLTWGDKRKAIIKRYPDGKQEILVPQTLTSEQEQYEFPPRSRLLKKLASSTAERQRLSTLQCNVSQAAPPSSPPEPDQGALAEWFSKRKDKAVLDWMSHIPLTTPLRQQHHPSVSCSPQLSANFFKSPFHSAIEFQSKAGRRWARDESTGLSSRKQLSPPDEHTRVHRIKRHLLQYHRQYVRVTQSATMDSRPSHTYSSHPPRPSSTSASVHLAAYQSPSRSNNSRVTYTMLHQWPHASPSYDVNRSSSSRLPALHDEALQAPSSSSNMLQLVQMFHKTLQDQQVRAQQRLKQLESLIQEERFHRQDLQRTQQMTMDKLDSLMTHFQHQHQSPLAYPYAPSGSISMTSPSSPRLQLPRSSSSPPLPPKSIDTAQSQPISPQTLPAATTTSGPTLTNSGLPLTPSSSTDHWAQRISSLEHRLENETQQRQKWERHMQDQMEVLQHSLSSQDQISQPWKNI
ncbi:hypothetical protein DM01DRAFT_1378089 [Hesseltinella vesiculosa]|uniref:Uncharacterized protein n=1 Tax=Hesseltinella vesiculosa TaxID=101127 RepID=A0A1X2G5F6_9FUNG|nr:hypothetical protein DM01DRAFT_1378089 [Hesseltinella vesiculosa]